MLKTNKWLKKTKVARYILYYFHSSVPKKMIKTKTRGKNMDKKETGQKVKFSGEGRLQPACQVILSTWAFVSGRNYPGAMQRQRLSTHCSTAPVS